MGKGFKDFDLDIPAGKEAGMIAVNKFGRNPDIDSAAAEDVWDLGGDWVAPTQERIHDIVSTSGNDDGSPVGTGARTVEIQGLNENWQIVKEIITLNGTTDVPTVNTYRRIFRMKVLTVGALGENVGIITATAQVDGTVTAQISATNNQTLMAIYTIPAGMTGYMKCYYGSLNQGSVSPISLVNLRLLVKPDASQSDSPFQIKHMFGLSVQGGKPGRHDFTPYFPITEKSDIKMRVTDITQNDSDVSAGFDLILVDN
jgi:hypothetical protein